MKILQQTIDLLKIARVGMKENKEIYPPDLYKRVYRRITDSILDIKNHEQREEKKGEWIKSTRTYLGLSLRQLEKKCGVSHENISNHEKDKFLSNDNARKTRDVIVKTLQRLLKDKIKQVSKKTSKKS